MISFKQDGSRFNYRVVGVAIKNNKVLFHKSDTDNFWALPGGRGEMFEKSCDTVIREMKEELDENIKVIRLLWIVENFFEYDEFRSHELSLYYLIEFCEKSKVYKNDEFVGVEGDKNLTFRWIDIDSIDKESIQPTFLKEGLKNIPNQITHIIQKDI